jgi:UPF0716 protein FxsA
MLRWIAALLLIPLADALFLVVVADFLGWQATVALVVLTALVGMVLVRAEGRAALRRIQEQAARGEPPTDAVMDGALLLVAGAFLLTPGLVTDTLGFVLVVPPTRYVVRTVLKRYVVTPYLDRKTGGFATGNVYTFGFPGDDTTGAWDESDAYDDDTFDLGSDAYDVEFDEDDDERGPAESRY